MNTPQKISKQFCNIVNIEYWSINNMDCVWAALKKDIDTPQIIQILMEIQVNTD